MLVVEICCRQGEPEIRSTNQTNIKLFVADDDQANFPPAKIELTNFFGSSLVYLPHPLLPLHTQNKTTTIEDNDNDKPTQDIDHVTASLH
jgi:hypothetical protein